jgi:transposase, IS6 family
MARTQPWKVSAALWERVEPLIPARPPYPKGGRPAADDRQMFAAIIYVLRTGIQWNALPRELGASSTVYDRFRQWESQGFFLRLWQAGLAEYDELASIGWDWQSVDSSTVKAPFATSRRRTRSHRLCCKKEADLLKLGKSRTKRIHYDRTEPLPRGVISKQTSFGCRVRWYLRYALSSRDLEEMMLERGLSVDHTTIYRWVQHYAPEFERRCRPSLKATTDSWRVDETYEKVKKEWIYLYRAVDSQGNTLEFLLSPTRDAKAAKRFFLKTLAASHVMEPRVMNVDKNAAYPKAFNELKAAGIIAENCTLRQVKYRGNLIEQDHRFIKRLTKPGMGFFPDLTAWRTLQGFEVMNMMRKGQLQGVDKGDVRGQMALVAKLFGVIA